MGYKVMSNDDYWKDFINIFGVEVDGGDGEQLPWYFPKIFYNIYALIVNQAI